MILAPSIHWGENPNYGFANGRVRALETLLFDRTQYERLIRAKDTQELKTLLLETRYGQLATLEPNTNLSQIFTAAAQENILFCITYAADLWLKALIQTTVDIFNLKIILKSRYQEKNPSADDLLPNGRWDEKTLNTIIAGDPKKFPKDQRHLFLAHRLVNEARQKAEQRHDPAIIDLLLDKLAQELALMWGTGNDYAEGYYRLYADITNLKMLIRLRFLNEDEQTFQIAFLPGGKLSCSQLLRIIRIKNLEPSALKELPGGELFFSLFDAGIRALNNRESFLPMEKTARVLLLDYINRARYVALGSEPLQRIVKVRENELTTLRQLDAAKIAGWGVRECQEVVVYGF